MKIKTSYVVLAIVVFCAAVAGGLYLFRSETYSNPILGEITYSYRWGQRALLLADTNFDGSVDVRARLDEIGGPIEQWEDSDHDGYMERHLIFEVGNIVLVEIDHDQDGAFEQRLVGAAAENYYKQNYREGDDGASR